MLLTRCNRFKGTTAFAATFFAALLPGCVMFQEKIETPGLQEQFIVGEHGKELHVFSHVRPNAHFRILYIHGTPGHAGAYRSQFVQNHANADDIAYDRPGFGSSAGEQKHPSLTYQALALHALFQNPRPASGNPQKIILVGHSYGAPVAVQAALDFPHEVAGILLIGGSISAKQEDIMAIQYLGNWGIIPQLLPSFLRNTNREILDLKEQLEVQNSKICELQLPVAMLHGTKDPLVPVENVDDMENMLKKCGHANILKKHVYEGYNHFIPWEHPEAVEKALADLENSIVAR